MPVSAPLCPYCNARAVLCDASAVYGPKFEGRFNLWACVNYPDCNAYVGVESGMDPRPLGTLANEELRKLRKKLRAATLERFGAAIKDPKFKRPKREAKRRREQFETTMKRINWSDEEECRRALMGLIAVPEETR